MHRSSPILLRSSEPRPGSLAIITVAHHSQRPLEALARQMAEQSEPPAHWIVVDNAPLSAPLQRRGALAGDTAACLGLEFLTGVEGAGFGAGCNQGLEWLAQREWTGWVWLLNPDTSLPEVDLLARLALLLAQQPSRALVGTAVRDGDGALEPSGGWIDPGLAFRRRRVGESWMAAARNQPLPVDWLSGCSLALKPEAHQPPARFDPALVLYYEDLDLCLRLSASGALPLWTAAITVAHQRGEGSSSDPDRRLELSTLSYCRFLQRHCSGWVQALRMARLLTTALLRRPWQPGRSRAVLRGLGRALREPLR